MSSQAVTDGLPTRFRLGSTGAVACWLAAYTVSYWIWRIGIGSEARTDIANRAAYLLPGLLAAWLAWQAARASDEPARKLAWKLVAAAFLTAKIGNLLWIVELLVPVPALSLASLGWLLFYPVLLAALLAFPRSPRRGLERWVSGLDIASMIAGLTMVILYVSLEPSVRQLGEMPSAMTLFYPFGVLMVLAVGAALPMRRLDDSHRLSYALLGLGLLVQFASDLPFAVSELEGSGMLSLLADLGGMTEWLLFGMAGVAASTAGSKTTAATPQGKLASLSPLAHGAVGVSFAVLIVAAVQRRTSVLPLVAAGALLLALLAILGQWLAARHNEQLRQERGGEVDPMTGLPMRPWFVARLREICGNPLTRGVAVAVVDINDLRGVNDAWGHANGDRLVARLAERLLVLRAQPAVARLGGDEFGLLWSERCDEEGIRRLAEEALAALSEPVELGGQRIQVSANIGLTWVDGAKEPDEILSEAFKALYHGKEGGRGHLAVHRPGMSPATVRRLRVESDLRRAIDRQEMTLHFQPIFSMRSGGAIGAEALLRWDHPERGLVGPSEFIDLAESPDLRDRLGDWVLESACRQAVAWGRERTAPAVFVNLSVRQMESSDSTVRIAAALASSGLAPERLVLEITEGQLSRARATVAAHLREVRSLGVRVALDDFGAGYSSLGRLRDLPVDILKLDRSLVQGVGSEEGAKFVRAVVQLGRDLGLAVIAEGVETAGEAEASFELGCELAQGFHFARPMPACELGTTFAPLRLRQFES